MVSGALPAHPASFIGREPQLADLRRLLHTTRLVTLTGPGGTGKTRLALRLAELCEFDRPTIFVPLASLSQPDLVPLAIASAMGVSESPGRSTEDAILAALCRRAALLILDNLEHLLTADQTQTQKRSVADLVSDLLAGCPHIKVLVTSREALRLTGEQVYPVPPLTLPGGDNGHAAESEAVKLFLDRARAASAVLPAGSDPDVAGICRRLEGLPLAIELAAARTAVLTPAALLRRLEQRLPLLVGGARDLPARQQTLRGAIAWSYDLLPPAEQALFRRLAVFHGGATLDAVATVCLDPDRRLGGRAREAREAFDQGARGSGGSPGGQTRPPEAPALDDLALLELLQSLAAKSMIRIEQDETGEPRFTMFETIREFGLEQLNTPTPGAPTGEAALIRGRHLAAYLELVRQRLDKRHATASRQWRGRLEREHDNLRSALRWCLETHDVERALALAGALWSFWYSQRHFSEGRAWLFQVLALADELLPAGTPHEGRARALLGAAWLAYKQGDPIATEHAERALALYRALGDPKELAGAR
jgi:predicted ATPase